MPDRNAVRLAGEHLSAQLSAGKPSLDLATGSPDASALRVTLDAAALWFTGISIDPQFAREVCSALEDAADYRRDQGGSCHDCGELPAGVKCRDHGVDDAMASMYDMRGQELQAHLERKPTGTGLDDLIRQLGRICETRHLEYDVSCTLTGDLWAAEVTLMEPDDMAGPRTGTIVETGGSLHAGDALVGAVAAAIMRLSREPTPAEREAGDLFWQAIRRKRP